MDLGGPRAGGRRSGGLLELLTSRPERSSAWAVSATAEQISPDGLVEDLFTVMDHHGVDRCVLAGESMGAATCLQAVLASPDRFLGVVLVGGVPQMVGPAPDTSQIRGDHAAHVHDFVDACIPEPDSEHVKRWGRQILLRTDPEAAGRMIESHFEQAIAPDLSKVSVPTLVILPSGHVPTMTRPLRSSRQSARGQRSSNRSAGPGDEALGSQLGPE